MINLKDIATIGRIIFMEIDADIVAEYGVGIINVWARFVTILVSLLVIILLSRYFITIYFLMHN